MDEEARAYKKKELEDRRKKLAELKAQRATRCEAPRSRAGFAVHLILSTVQSGTKAHLCYASTSACCLYFS